MSLKYSLKVYFALPLDVVDEIDRQEKKQPGGRNQGFPLEIDPGPGAGAGELCLPWHLDTLQHLTPLQKLHASPPEESSKTDERPSSPGLPRSVAGFPSEGQAGGDAVGRVESR